MKTVRLTSVDQQRIENIARAAGCSTEHALAFVLRDGFDATERVLRAVARARDCVAVEGAVDHVAAMAKLDAMLRRHGATSNQAA